MRVDWCVSSWFRISRILTLTHTRVRVWRCEGRPPLPHHFVCVEKFTYLTLDTGGNEIREDTRTDTRTDTGRCGEMRGDATGRPFGALGVQLVASHTQRGQRISTSSLSFTISLASSMEVWKFGKFTTPRSLWAGSFESFRWIASKVASVPSDPTSRWERFRLPSSV